ncbi:MAG: extracellular solute-binding protein [Chloroflexi bacterium]|nr:extracellular solute-binding protein [Chloroflexota bacterium]
MRLDGTRSPRLRAAAVLLTAGLLLAACGSAASPTPAPSAAPTTAPTAAPASEAPSAAPTEAPAGAYPACVSAATTPITLTIWDQEVREGIGTAIEQLNGEFTAANPGVTIKREQKSFDDLKATVKLALADPAGPDIAQVNQGRPDMGAAVQAGLLLPLTDYAATYGWTERWGAGVLARNSFSDDGKTFGTGTLYGVSVTGEIVGLFISIDVGAKYELPGRPASFDELMQAFETVKAGGGVPIAFGALDGDALQIYASILQTMVSAQWLDDFIYGRNNVSFNTPETIAAAAKLVEMSDKGYFTPGYEGIGYDDSVKLFSSGQGLALWTGSWIGATLTEQAGEKFGFIRTPPQTAGGSALSIGGVGLPWSIRKTSANPDCAAAYLDWITSDHAMELVASLGALPGHSGGAMPGTSALFNEMAAAFAEANSKNEVGHYLDWAFPTGWDTFKAQLAELLAKRITPEQFVANVDAEYQAFLATLK